MAVSTSTLVVTSLALSVATSAASAMISYQQQSAQAAVQKKAIAAQNAAIEKQNQMIFEESIRQYGELDRAEAKSIFDAHSKSISAQKEYMQARAKMETQASASGTMGQTVNTSLQALAGDREDVLNDIEYVNRRNLADINQEAENIRYGTLGRYNYNYNYNTVQQPSAFAAVVGGVGDAFGNFNSYYNAMSSIKDYWGPSKNTKTGANTGVK